MQILHVDPTHAPALLEDPGADPGSGFLWLDATRDEDWPAAAESLLGAPLHEHHISDLRNLQHRSYCDRTGDYEMLIFRSLAPAESGEDFPTRPLGVLLGPRLLVTVRDPDSRSVATVRQRLLAGQGRCPGRPAGLLHLLLAAVIDRFLENRTRITERLDDWRERMLGAAAEGSDWHGLLRFGSQLRQLERLCEEQHDALVAWQELTDTEIDPHLQVRINDLIEHIERVQGFATARNADIESLVQLHFAATAHRTNEIVRVLTVLSAIFLPLTLVAGIFGMNFDYMPELRLRYAYFVALGGMLALALGLLLLFRRRRWV